EAAPDRVAAFDELHLELEVPAREHDRRAGDVLCALALEAQVVRVLPEVGELDDRDAGADGLPGEDEVELVRGHLDAHGRSGRDHALKSTGREKDRAFGITLLASVPSHCSSSDA